MKAYLLVLAILTPGFAAPAAFAWGNDCEYSRTIEREVAVSASMLLNVDAGAGELDIKGIDGRTSVLIDAKLCAETEDQLADMDVVSKTDDGVAYFKTELAKGKLWNTGSNGSYIDLTLHVPTAAKLDVRDSSGEASIEKVGSLVMLDSSGELTIEGVSGDVRVKDSSGSLRIEKVSGSVWVKDSSGSIKVEDVTGDFTVEFDSSGSIEAERVTGSVLVRVDSSGSIEVNDIGGDFTVGKDSSGGIYHKNVSGDISLPN